VVERGSGYGYGKIPIPILPEKKMAYLLFHRRFLLRCVCDGGRDGKETTVKGKRRGNVGVKKDLPSGLDMPETSRSLGYRTLYRPESRPRRNARWSFVCDLTAEVEARDVAQ
jgi:hypothetical protein